MMGVLAILLAVAIGFSAVRWAGIARGLGPRGARIGLELGLGAGAGVALTGGLYYVLLNVGLVHRWVLLGIEAVLLLILVTAVRRQSKRPDAGEEPEPPPRPGWRWNRLLAGLLAVALLLIVLAEIDTARLSPHGNWDAFAVWNVRAKFLLGEAELWQRSYSEYLDRTHPEYPLLLSSFIARGWRLNGDEMSPYIPFATAVLLFFAMLALLAAALSLMRGTSSGLIAAFLVLGNTALLKQASWQYADIPLSFFFLATVLLMLLSVSERGKGNPALPVAAGFLASVATLTKDEGIPFFLLSSVCYAALVWRMHSRSELLPRVRVWVFGALPGVLMTAHFKVFLAPSGGQFSGPPPGEAIPRLFEFDRYATLAGSLAGELVAMGSGWSHPLLLLALLAAVLRFDIAPKQRFPVLMAAALLGLQFVTYCGVYLMTGDELVWRLGTSLERLFAQLWPWFLLLAFLVIGVPRDPVAAEAGEPAGSRREKKKRKR